VRGREGERDRKRERERERVSERERERERGRESKRVSKIIAYPPPTNPSRPNHEIFTRHETHADKT
jgi:hypothetical protein